MKYLFLDNFRGFTNATIPLADVNFLVGENSTGKTSFLTALRIFSGPSIFMSPEGGEEVLLGHFSEMVSAHSSDQSYFRLGYADERGGAKDRRGNGLLLTYRQVGGMAQIARLTTTMLDQEVSLNIEEGKVSYFASKVPKAENAKDMLKRLHQWAGDHNKPASGWTQLELPPGMDASQIEVAWRIWTGG